MSEKLPVSWRNIFDGVVNTAFHMSTEKIWDKRVFSPKNIKFDILFWFLMKKFRICGRSFRQGCPKQNPRDQRNFFVKFYSEEDTTLYLLMVFLRKIWFAKKLQVRQWGIVRVQWKFLRDEILEETKPFQLLGTERESFGFLPEQNWQSCQNCIPCDQSTIWSKLNFFLKKNAISILFPTFSEKLPCS